MSDEDEGFTIINTPSMSDEHDLRSMTISDEHDLMSMMQEAEWTPAGMSEATAAAIREALAESKAVEDNLDANRKVYFGPGRTCAPGALVFFHGTGWESAQSIKQDGFIPSEAGCLGPGVYVGRCDKALRFARDAARHRQGDGGLVKVTVMIRNPKFVSSNDDTWQHGGYDSCRADHTSHSEHMEWCLADTCNLEVVSITRVPIDPATRVPIPAEVRSLPPSQPLTAEICKWILWVAGGNRRSAAH